MFVLSAFSTRVHRAPACRSSIDIAEEEPDVDEDSMKEAGDLGVPFIEPDLFFFLRRSTVLRARPSPRGYPEDPHHVRAPPAERHTGNTMDIKIPRAPRVPRSSMIFSDSFDLNRSRSARP